MGIADRIERSYGLSVTTEPASEPVSYNDFAQHAALAQDDQAEYCVNLLKAARQHVELYLNRTLINTVYALKLDRFPRDGWVIRPPRPPLISIASITYTDIAGATQTWSSSDYQVDTAIEPGRVFPAYNEAWPDTRTDTSNAVTVNYTGGYGTAASDVPAGIRQAILLLASQWYEFREPVITGTIVAKVPFTVEALLSPYMNAYTQVVGPQ